MTHQEFSRRGGKAGRGKAKARKVTRAQAQKAVNARWAKYYTAKATASQAAS